MVKKFVALLMALVLLVALAAPAFAANVTIDATPETGTEAGETYKAYKIFDATVKEGTDLSEQPGGVGAQGGVSYTIEKSSPFYETLKAFGRLKNAPPHFTFTGEGDTQVVTQTEGRAPYEATDLAAALKAVITDETPCITFVDSKAELPAGYYLITSTLGSAMIVDTFGEQDMTITTKNEFPTIDLIIIEAQQGKIAEDGKSASVSYLYPVTWKLTINVPETADQEIRVDIDIENGNIIDIYYVIDEDGNRADPTWTKKFAKNDMTWAGFTITIPADKVKEAAGGTLTYEIWGDETPSCEPGRDYTQTAVLTYSQYTSAPSSTVIKTFEVDLVKTNSSNDVLPGAKFQLLDAQGNVVKLGKGIRGGESYSVFPDRDPRRDGALTVPGGNITEIEAGNVTIEGLGEAKFTLKEIAAPAGYNPVTTPIEFTPKANMKATVTEGKYVEGGVEVENLTGAELPSTGGVGTTIFYIVGGLLVAGAAVLLVTKKRAQG